MTSIPATSFGYPQSNMRAWAECTSTSVNCSCGTKWTVTTLWFMHVLWCRTCTWQSTVFRLTAWYPAFCLLQQESFQDKVQKPRRKETLNLLGCDAAALGKQIPVFCMSVLPSYSGLHGQSLNNWKWWEMILRTTGSHLSCCAVSHPRRLEPLITVLWTPENVYVERWVNAWRNWSASGKHIGPVEMNCAC